MTTGGAGRLVSQHQNFGVRASGDALFQNAMSADLGWLSITYLR